MIRRATAVDLEPVVACQTACWAEAYAGVVDPDYLTSPGVLARRLDRWRDRLAGGRDVWVAEEHGAVVGVASAAGRPGESVELTSLYVRQDHQGRGLGGALLSAAIGAAGPAQLWVFDVNADARAFYGRHGFAPDGATMIDDDTGLVLSRMVRA